MNAGGYGDKSNVPGAVARNDLRIVIIGKIRMFDRRELYDSYKGE